MLKWFFVTQMTRRCWSLSGLGVGEEPWKEMMNQVKNVRRGKSDIAIQLITFATWPSDVLVASNYPLSIPVRVIFKYVTALTWNKVICFGDNYGYQFCHSWCIYFGDLCKNVWKEYSVNCFIHGLHDATVFNCSKMGPSHVRSDLKNSSAIFVFSCIVPV